MLSYSLFRNNKITLYSDDDLNRRFLRPASPSKGRIASPGDRRSSGSSTAQSGYGSRGSYASSSVSVPASPTIPSSKYHRGCIVPPSASYPSGFPQIANSNGAAVSGESVNNKFISDSASNEVSSATSSTASTVRRPTRNSRSRSRSRSRNSSPFRSNGGISSDNSTNSKMSAVRGKICNEITEINS